MPESEAMRLWQVKQGAVPMPCSCLVNRAHMLRCNMAALVAAIWALGGHMYRLKCVDKQTYLAMFPHNITYINKMNQERERYIYMYYMMDIYIYLAFEGEKGYSELLWVWTPSGTIEITCLFLNCRVWAMPSKPCPGLIQGYLDQFGRFPELRQRGFSFLIDCSGRLFTAKKPSLKDIEGNIEAAETVGKISVYCHAFKNHVVDLQTILGPFSP